MAAEPSATQANAKETMDKDDDDKEEAMPALVECPVCFDRPDQPAVTPCGHIGCFECMSTVIQS